MIKVMKKIYSYWKAAYNHFIFQLLVLIGATYVLFSSDTEIMLNLTTRQVIMEIRSLWLIFFIVEFISSNSVENNYFLSLYCLIDFIDLVSLATEVYYIWNPFLEFLDSNSM